MVTMSDESLASPNGFWASKRRTEKITKILVSIVLAIGAVAMMLPIVWMLSTSFKVPEQIFSTPPSNVDGWWHTAAGWHTCLTNWWRFWVPTEIENGVARVHLHFENYPKAWTISGMYSSEEWSFLGVVFHGITFTTYTVNTLIIAVLSCVGI